MRRVEGSPVKPRWVLMLALSAACLAATVPPVLAFSPRVKVACMQDYFSHCSSHSVGSPGLRRCMRAAGPALSRGCIRALVSAGEVSQAEISRRAASLR